MVDFRIAQFTCNFRKHAVSHTSDDTTRKANDLWGWWYTSVLLCCNRAMKYARVIINRLIYHANVLVRFLPVIY